MLIFKWIIFIMTTVFSLPSTGYSSAQNYNNTSDYNGIF